MSLPRVAFVGFPRGASRWMLEALGQVCTLEAICGENAEREVARYRARWAFSDLGSLLKEAAPEGVVLDYSIQHRTRLIKECLAAGAGVLITGVPGSASGCGRISTLARLAGRFVLAAPAIRFAPAMCLARRLVDSGKFGEPISMCVRSTRRGSTQSTVDGQGAVDADQIFETVDIAHHLIGPISRVFAISHGDGAMVVTAVTDTGVPVSLVCHGSGAAESVGVEFEIRNADGTRLTLDRDCRLLCRHGSRVDGVHGVGLAVVNPAIELGFEGLIAEFRRYLQSSKPDSGLSGPVRSVTATTEAVLASAVRQRVVTPKSPKATGREGLREKSEPGK